MQLSPLHQCWTDSQTCHSTAVEPVVPDIYKGLIVKPLHGPHGNNCTTTNTWQGCTQLVCIALSRPSSVRDAGSQVFPEMLRAALILYDAFKGHLCETAAKYEQNHTPVLLRMPPSSFAPEAPWGSDPLPVHSDPVPVKLNMAVHASRKPSRCLVFLDFRP